MPTRTPRAETRRLTRRDLLTTASAALTGTALVTFAASHAAAAEKVSKDQVSYQDTPKNDQYCADCRFFQEPNACERVEGEISPEGWCALWSPKPE